MAEVESALKEEVVEGIKSKLKLLKIEFPENEPFDKYISSFSDEVEQYILNYCNIYEIPKGLKYTWINLTADYINWAIISIKNAQGDLGNMISMMSSLKIGDTNMSLKSSGSSNSASPYELAQAQLKIHVMSYWDSLNKFRRIVW